MKITISLLTLFCSFCFLNSKAQNQYWQQKVDYTIQVKLDDKSNELIAFEEFIYTNNSPNTLNEIFIHLWPNAYKNKETAFAKQKIDNKDTRFLYAKKEDLGFIDSLNFKVDGQFAKLEFDKENIDIGKIILNRPLKSGEKIKISTPFTVKIPYSFSRLGRVGDSYQITQWYPKPAVYDVSGWHPIPYLDQGEFYSEFGTFDVSITLPSNYIVGATGDLQTASEIKFMDSLAEISNKRDSFSTDNSFPKSSDKDKTIRFIQKDVHDFAWFADKRFNVMKSEVELPNSKNKVTTWALFTNSSTKFWKKGTQYINDAIYYYSLWNGDYPYKHATAIDGALSAGAGMEYPNITIIGPVGNDISLEDFIVHEVGHNWFYGIFGTNERRYAWMDEGMNSFNEKRYLSIKYPKASEKLLGYKIDLKTVSDYLLIQGNPLVYYLSARQNADQAINLPSTEYTNSNYGGVVYGKSALEFKLLQSYLGDELFDSCMHTYFKEWNLKHPQPKDLQNVFEKISRKKLDWFFVDGFNSTQKFDYKISSIKKTSEGYNLKIKNNSIENRPVFLLALNKNNEVIESKWIEGFEHGAKEIVFQNKETEKYIVNRNGIDPELNQKNNTIRTKGLFKKTEKLNVSPIIGLYNPERSQTILGPAGAYDYQDGFMFGAYMSNLCLPAKQFVYAIAPLYSPSLNQFKGTGIVSYTFLPQSIFSKITPSVSFSNFSNLKYEFIDNFSKNIKLTTQYYKLNPKIDFYLKPKFERSSIHEKISLRTTFIQTNLQEIQKKEITRDYLADKYTVTEIGYTYRNSRLRNPYSISANYRFDLGNSLNSGFSQQIFSEQNLSVKYSPNLRAIGIRFFEGYVVKKKNGYMNFNQNNSDYLYDEVLLGRTPGNNISRYQFIPQFSQFKQSYASSGQSDWQIAANFKIPFPKYLPIGIYSDVLFEEELMNINGKLQNFYMDAGLYVWIIKDHVEIYFPLYNNSSADLKAVNYFGTNNYTNQIRFVLDLKYFNPIELLSNISL